MSTRETHITTAEADFSGDQVLTIREILSKYLYHWPVFLISLIICLAGSYLYLRYTQPIFRVTSILLIKDAAGNRGAGSDILNRIEQGGAGSGGFTRGLDNEMEVIKSRTLMKQVVDRLHLNVLYKSEGRLITTDAYDIRPVNFIPVAVDESVYNHEFQLTFPKPDTYLLVDVVSGKKVIGPLNTLHRTRFGVYKIDRTPDAPVIIKEKFSIRIVNPESIVSSCLGSLSLENKNKRSTVVELAYVTPVVKQGEDILNTLVQVYNEAALLDKNKAVKRTLAFIDDQLKPISGELKSVEISVEDFKSSQGLTDINSQADIYLNSVKSTDAQLSEVNIKLAVIQDIQRYINSNSLQEKLPTTMGIDDPGLLSQINQLNTLQLQKDQLLATTPLANPIYDPINRQIETTRANIRASVNNIGRSLMNTKRQLERNSSTAQSSIKKIPGQERQFISIERQQKTKEALYLYLLQKKQETELAYASAVADTRLIDPAIGTGGPIKPQRQLIQLAALLMGLILPAAYVHGKDLLNNKVTTKAELSKLTHAPLLGELSYEEGIEAIVVSATSRKAIAEQFRAIRTNLQFIQGKRSPDDGGRVTLLTSSVSGEGKSFVATNLGAALAISGRKTIILELDLRKPKVIKYLNLSTKVGLSNYLIGKSTYEEVLLESGVHPKLFVIGSGPIPPNPSELLMQSEIEDLIANLKKNFDEIIIDAPPIGLVTDAQILARLADSTIYIVRHAVTLKSQIEQFDVLYRQHKFPKLNLILNGIQTGGRYGYSYGYGYGYYNDEAKSKRFSLKRLLKNFFGRF